jgi:hypothetical protein
MLGADAIATFAGIAVLGAVLLRLRRREPASLRA